MRRAISSSEYVGRVRSVPAVSTLPTDASGLTGNRPWRTNQVAKAEAWPKYSFNVLGPSPETLLRQAVNDGAVI
jgi:hypothetical protein